MTPQGIFPRIDFQISTYCLCMMYNSLMYLDKSSMDLSKLHIFIQTLLLLLNISLRKQYHLEVYLLNSVDMKCTLMPMCRYNNSACNSHKYHHYHNKYLDRCYSICLRKGMDQCLCIICMSYCLLLRKFCNSLRILHIFHHYYEQIHQDIAVHIITRIDIFSLMLKSRMCMHFYHC
jgi:hypothetical protein